MRLALAFLFALCAASASLAQNVNVVGPADHLDVNPVTLTVRLSPAAPTQAVTIDIELITVDGQEITYESDNINSSDDFVIAGTETEGTLTLSYSDNLPDTTITNAYTVSVSSTSGDSSYHEKENSIVLTAYNNDYRTQEFTPSIYSVGGVKSELGQLTENLREGDAPVTLSLHIHNTPPSTFFRIQLGSFNPVMQGLEGTTENTGTNGDGIEVMFDAIGLNSSFQPRITFATTLELVINPEEDADMDDEELQFDIDQTFAPTVWRRLEQLQGHPQPGERSTRVFVRVKDNDRPSFAVRSDVPRIIDEGTAWTVIPLSLIGPTRTTTAMIQFSTDTSGLLDPAGFEIMPDTGILPIDGDDKGEYAVSIRYNDDIDGRDPRYPLALTIVDDGHPENEQELSFQVMDDDDGDAGIVIEGGTDRGRVIVGETESIGVRLATQPRSMWWLMLTLRLGTPQHRS